MARKCYVTGLGSVSGNNRSHSLQATRRTWKANLQKVRIKDTNERIFWVWRVSTPRRRVYVVATFNLCFGAGAHYDRACCLVGA